MSDDKKKYVCKLPTNGHQPGDEVFLTDAEVRNFNAGDPEPRFVLAAEQEETEQVVVDQQMLDENPALKDASVKVGDVGVPATPEQTADLNARTGQEAPPVQDQTQPTPAAPAAPSDSGPSAQ